MTLKVAICGAGFLGSNIAKTILSSTSAHSQCRVQLSNRNPERVHESVSTGLIPDQAKRLDPPRPVDVTRPETIRSAFSDANVIVSLVGVMHGTVEDFERIQWKGAENVAKFAQSTGAKLIHISAIGADSKSAIPYARTKALGEDAVLAACPTATIIRPSILFGPGDGFFGRFAQLSKVLPFMPVFGGGQSLFQPVYVGDIAAAVEVIARDNEDIRTLVDGKIIEAGGPDVLTYRQIIELVLRYTHRWRPIISVPYAVGTVQGFVLENLPINLFTLTRAQVEQLKDDNIVKNATPSAQYYPFKELLEKFASSRLTSVHEILPQYLPAL
ncbi:hypothetical protein PHLCEN_2v3836 [Hermanssonia centrifuga]|uniref:NAD-dependent epimerase/dehydratase domain-containing protein n=1 Tax=Hermanssonia centrifuga TaxID=98765 RepID=A0A2R6QBF8_9APHY|nr:hypothetical protein PHLCEN_2v3836 [Hermanssonia centrifuga]